MTSVSQKQKFTIETFLINKRVRAFGQHDTALSSSCLGVYMLSFVRWACFVVVYSTGHFQRFKGKRRNLNGEHFWARGYYVSTVGLDEEMVREYIRHQESNDEKRDQMSSGV